MCHVTLDHGGVQGGTRPKRVASLYILQRSRNLHSQSQFSSKHLPQICACLGRSQHSSISSATIFSILFQTSWHALTPSCMASPLHTRPYSQLLSTPFQTVWLHLLSLSGCPLNAQPGASCVT